MVSRNGWVRSAPAVRYETAQNASAEDARGVMLVEGSAPKGGLQVKRFDRGRYPLGVEIARWVMNKIQVI